MPVKLKKFGKQWCSSEAATGKKPGKGRCFSSRAKALKQVQAININLLKQKKGK